MGFGLHFGWAIEGAIGSMYKIDASYLSPNVNIAARLETATRLYGVSLLVSGTVQRLFSDKIKLTLREIDRVTVKGSMRPIKLFTVPVTIDKLNGDTDRYQQMTSKHKKDERIFEKETV